MSCVFVLTVGSSLNGPFQIGYYENNILEVPTVIIIYGLSVSLACTFNFNILEFYSPFLCDGFIFFIFKHNYMTSHMWNKLITMRKFIRLNYYTRKKICEWLSSSDRIFIIRSIVPKYYLVHENLNTLTLYNISINLEQGILEFCFNRLC